LKNVGEVLYAGSDPVDNRIEEYDSMGGMAAWSVEAASVRIEYKLLVFIHDGLVCMNRVFVFPTFFFGVLSV
jgi:hypothetical protein